MFALTRLALLFFIFKLFLGMMLIWLILHISLYNVTYRILSKIITLRLKNVLQKIISPFQNAFIKERQIFDNTIIMKEIMKNLSKKKCLKRHIVILTDLKKAFDQVNYSFILNTFSNLSFPNKWCSVIKQCITLWPCHSC